MLDLHDTPQDELWAMIRNNAPDSTLYQAARAEMQRRTARALRYADDPGMGPAERAELENMD